MQRTLQDIAQDELREALAGVGVALDFEVERRLLDALVALGRSSALADLLEAQGDYYAHAGDSERDIQQALGRRLLERVEATTWAESVKDDVTALIEGEIDWTMVLY